VSASPSAGPSPLQVTLDASGSSDPDGDALLFAWDFGDGSPTQGGAAVTHTYMTDGPFDAVLTVSDGRGGASSVTDRILVGHPPVCGVTSPAVGARYDAGDTIPFEGTATDAEDGPCR